MSELNTNPNPQKREMKKIEIVGLILVFASLLGLFFAPGSIAGFFNAMVGRVFPIVVTTTLMGTLGVSIICSVLMGRVLERLGFTDALMRIFLPVTRWLNVNTAILIPAIYNILGDINAAGRIAGPILVKAGATKDEQKIAICTMMQSQQSFSTFMFGLIALTAVGVNAAIVTIVALFLPLIIVPWLLKLTIWRNTKAVSLNELPSFTPEVSPLTTLFSATREGAELVFLLIIPAYAAVFAIIGALEYIGVWQPIQAGLTTMLTVLSIDPKSGMTSILASPTLAMSQLKDVAAGMNPKLVVGSFVLGASGFPLSVMFAQIPVIWSGCTDLTNQEAMNAAILGAIMRIITAGAVAMFLTPLLV